MKRSTKLESRPDAKMTRREALARLGLRLSAVYVAPALMTLSSCAISGEYGGSIVFGTRRSHGGSKPSMPSKASHPSKASRPSKASGPSNVDGTSVEVILHGELE